MKSFTSWKHNICITCVILGLSLLTGCWDNRDIEELSLRVGLGLDRADGDIKLESEPLVVTETFQNIFFKGPAGGQGQTSFKNISITGNVTSKTISEAVLTIPYEISHHLKVIIISEALARYMNWENLVSIVRNPMPRLSAYMMITKDQAKNIFENKEEQSSEIPAMKIFRIADNNKDSLRLLDPVSLARVASWLADGRSFLLPCIMKQNEEVLFKDAAVISGKTKKLVGFINSEEITGFKWLKGTKGGGILNVFNRRNKQLFTLRIMNISSKITPHVRGDQISFAVKVTVEGTLFEDWIEGSDASDKKFLQKLEKEAERKIVYQIRSTLYKLQKQYHADAADFGEVLRIGYPQTFQKVKQNWDETFAGVPIDVHVDVKIKGYNLRIKKKG